MQMTMKHLSEDLFKQLTEKVRIELKCFQIMIQEDAVNWEGHFSSGRILLDKVLEFTLTNDDRINAYNDQFYLTKEEVTEEDLESALTVTEWMFENLPKKSRICSKLITLCKPINQDALSKITNAIAFDGAGTEEIFQSLNSRRAQLGHFDRRNGLPKILCTWDWRKYGHNFWNIDLNIFMISKIKRAVRFL